MLLLLAFAFLAGAATAITPCVLPVLPALLSASGTGGRPRRVRVQLYGRRITPADAGEDVRDGVVTVRRQRLYRLVKRDTFSEHVITLRLDAGVSGFAFTFG